MHARASRGSRAIVAPLILFLIVASPLASPGRADAQPCTGTPSSELGVVTAVPGACSLGPGPVPNTICRQLLVECSGLDPLIVQLRVTEPDSTVPTRGTVMVGSGGGGAGFYSSQAGASALFSSLAAMGFRVVDRAWPPPNGWMTAEGGLRIESCRYATLLTWVHDNLHTQGAFVATGNSGGSAELAYALSNWGRDAILDLAVPTGGPPLSRMDFHCGADSTWLSMCPGIVPDESLDCTAACLIPPNHPACLQCNEGPTAAQLAWDSILNSDADLDYPGTKLHVIFGRQDCSSAVPMGMLFYNAVTSTKELQFVPSTPHFVAGSPEGREAIRGAIEDGTPGAVDTPAHVDAVAGPRVRTSPNPFVREVDFLVTVPKRTPLSLRVFDVSGRLVATLLEGTMDAGEHRARFDAGELASGVYFYRLRTPWGVTRGTVVRVR